MDLTETIVPRSDQLNSEDLLTGPRIITVTDVRRGSTEQPVEIVTAEFGPGRPFKPSKTVRRILVAAWGKDASVYAGRRMMIYRDPEVRFGGSAVGGIRVSALSHIDEPVTVALTVTRGRRAPFTVEPLPEPERTQIPDTFVAKVRSGNLTKQECEKAMAYLDKVNVDPDTVAELRGAVNDMLSQLADQEEETAQ
ncbi:hypothetical protein [Gordonia rubripertincta]|uniref:hypothetical protein n=1 Tax=Gordonia rubripertincta TaxID=36822 RepID=UPI0015FD4008|nr:hypothetical protein [Gordonia rubripertincta]QMU19318.1 hypothetical protein H3V45_14580 [Gordonia rubripertincta]